MRVKIFFSDGKNIEKEVDNFSSAYAVLLGAYESMYSIVLSDPEYFKIHHIVKHQIFNYDGAIIESETFKERETK